MTYEALTKLSDHLKFTPAVAEAIWGDVDEELFLRERAGILARWTRAINDQADRSEPVIVIDEAGLEQAVATTPGAYANQEMLGE